MKKVLFSMAICLATSSMFFSCGGDDDGGGTNGDPKFGTITDTRDNKTYQTVKIGNQTWMAENLDYREGQTGITSCYNDVEANCDTLGALYDFEAAQVACPPGSHLPSDSEWKTLEEALGMDAQELDLEGWRGDGVGTEMKQGDVNLVLGGQYQFVLNCNCYSQLSEFGKYWTSTIETIDTTSFFRQVTSISNFPTSQVWRGPADFRNRYSIRCVIED